MVEKTKGKGKNERGTYARRRVKIVGLIAIILIVIVGVYFLVPLNLFQGENKGSNQAGQIRQVNLDNLPDYLKSSEFVKDLSGSAVISLVVGENYFTVEKDEVKEGKAEDPDLEIWFSEEYLADLGKNGICNTVVKAGNAGDYTVEVFISEFELLFKYGRMLKHKDCLSP